MSKGVRWLLSVIIVALVGALVTAVFRGCAGPAELGADLNDVAIDRNVTLDEYAIRHENAAGARRLGSALVIEPEVHLVAQTTPEDLPQDEPQADEPEPDEPDEPDEPQPDEPQPDEADEPQPDEPQPDEPQPDEPTPGGETPTDSAGILLRRQLSPQDSEQFKAGVGEAIDESQIDVGPACERDPGDQDDCPFQDLVFLPADVDQPNLTVEEEGPLSAEAVARRLKKIFDGTRTLPASPASGKRRLVGVTVNFKVTMTGFDEGSADIRWSLYSAGGKAPVPRDWLRTQRALSLRGEADKDSASGEFWVPIPKAAGPFFIRLGVYDDDNTRLDYADTPRFR